MTRWWWIRHAPVVGHDGRLYGNLDVDCDCGDEPLFRALAAKLPSDAMWIVSPLARARATAAALTRHLAKGPEDLHVEPLLVEQDFGRWQGLTYAELAAGHGDAWHRFWLAPAEATPPEGESFAALATRVAGAVDALTRRHAGRDIVCVSHGGTIRAAIAHALAVAPRHALGFAIDNCSLTRLDHIAAEDPPTMEGPTGEGPTGEGPTGEGATGERASGSWRIALVNAPCPTSGTIAAGDCPRNDSGAAC